MTVQEHKELTAWPMEFASIAELMLIAPLETPGMEIREGIQSALELSVLLLALTTELVRAMKIA
jgi:hypothetical protein